MDISVADELIKLKGLQEQGVITQEEFDLQKTKLLNNSNDDALEETSGNNIKYVGFGKPSNAKQQRIEEMAKKIQKKKAAKNSPISCTYCKSQNVQFMQNKKKGFSFKKFAAGNILGGNTTAATVAGFSGKSGKNEWYCNDCGRTFLSK